ncbi:MAG: sulfatase-like hydrolase/transferase [Acidobacteriota bacterium]
MTDSRDDRRTVTTPAPILLLLALLFTSCSEPSPPPAETPPWLLLITLDTTRADALGPGAENALREARGLDPVPSGPSPTPALDALADRAARFPVAYTTAPLTLPSHTSMLTGLLPHQHGVHENSRRLRDDVGSVAQELAAAGYRTVAHVSAVPLLRQFGLNRGFDTYDDQLQGRSERSAADTTLAALETLQTHDPQRPLFLWVHYYDPHEPYQPPPPFDTDWDDPYLGEIAAMDEQVGRLVEAFEALTTERVTVIVGDHGEGLGEHGEMLHGNLLFESVARVPMLAFGTDIETGDRAGPRSIAQVRATLLDAAGLLGDKTVKGNALNLEGWSLLAEPPPIVVAEAMKPHLQYGWQPQIMVSDGVTKALRTDEVEVWDLSRNPRETSSATDTSELPAVAREALRAVPLPTAAAFDEQVSVELRQRLQSLGYTSSGEVAPPREEAPRPSSMAHLFAALDRGSGLFVDGRYEEVVELFSRVLAEDPENLMVTLRLAVAESTLGRERRADELFLQAESLAPESIDVVHFAALHARRFGRLDRAEVGFRRVLETQPQRLAALRGLASIALRQGDDVQAEPLLERAAALAPDPAADFEELGHLHMRGGNTQPAIRAFERSRRSDEERFGAYLELGILYLADRRPQEAREALDAALSREQPSTERAMALFKRAQVAALLNEPDRAAWVRDALAESTPETEVLVRRERLFEGLLPR